MYVTQYILTHKHIHTCKYVYITWLSQREKEKLGLQELKFGTSAIIIPCSFLVNVFKYIAKVCMDQTETK